MPICCKCRVDKEPSEFYTDKIRSNGLSSYCKKCLSAGRRRKLGVTPEQYEQMLEQQSGVCAICEQPEINRELAVDHDHKTNKVRGLLCNNCNQMLGRAKDNIRILTKAIEYLFKGDN